jgi:hypothetical protein
MEVVKLSSSVSEAFRRYMVTKKLFQISVDSLEAICFLVGITPPGGPLFDFFSISLFATLVRQQKQQQQAINIPRIKSVLPTILIDHHIPIQGLHSPLVLDSRAVVQ